MGNLLQWHSGSEKIRLVNTASQEIHILDLHANCACTDVRCDKTWLKPGESTILNVDIAMGDRHGLVQARVEAKWKAIPSNIEGNTLIKVNCHAVTMLKCSLDPIEYGNIDVKDGAKSINIDISTGDSPLIWSGLKASATFTKVCLIHSGDRRFTLTARLDPAGLPLGTFKDRIDLSLLRDGREIGEKRILDVGAKIVSKEVSVPQSLYLGVFTPGKIKSGTLVIESLNGKSIEFESINLKNSEFIRLHRQNSNNSRQLIFSYAASSDKIGDHSSLCKIRFKVGTEYEASIPIIALVN